MAATQNRLRRHGFFFFFNDPPPPDISPLPLHDALPFGVRQPPPCPAVQHRPHAGVSPRLVAADSLSLHRPATRPAVGPAGRAGVGGRVCLSRARKTRSEEHTSELQSPCKLVCRLLLEKK